MYTDCQLNNVKVKINSRFKVNTTCRVNNPDITIPMDPVQNPG